jgi:ankyrin repeat protein
MEKSTKLSAIALAMIVFCGFLAAPAGAQYSENYKLKKAIGEGNQYDARAAILGGAQVNSRDEHDVPFIVMAANKGDATMVYIMLDQGGNPDLAGRDGKTPLMIAADHGYDDMAKVLISYKADVNKQDRNGETALIKAARAGDREIVEDLIKAKANLDLQDYTGKSALGYAIDNRRTRVVDDLKKAGATE